MFILTILKWILIVLLSILLVTLILVAYLLILPVFYHIEIDFDDKSFEVHSKDILRLYNIGISHKNKKTGTSLKVLFGLINLSPKEGKSRTKKEKPESKEVNSKITEDLSENKDYKEDKKEDKKETKERIKKLLKEKDTYEAIKYAIMETFKTIKKLFPKEFYAKMNFSLGKPDLTGLFTGGLSLLPFIYQNNSKVFPDFLSEKAYVNGHLKIKGNFTLINFVILFTKLIINKQIRRILQTLL